MPDIFPQFTAFLIGSASGVPGLCDLLASVFPGARVEAVTEVPADAVIPAVSFLDFSSGVPEAFAALHELQTDNPSAAVVALLPDNKPELILDCLRAGASAFLMQPYTADQLEAAIQTIARRVPALNIPAPAGLTIAVVPARGGAGATTLACDLAFECHRQGLARTLLCDLDPLAGTISFRLKMKSQHSFLDALTRDGVLEPGLWKQMVQPSAGVDVLLAPERIVDPSAELGSAEPLLRWSKSSYDITFADTSGPYGDWNVSIARHADTVLLVCRADLPCLHGVRRAMSWFGMHGIPGSRVKVILNHYSPAGPLAAERLAEAVGVEPFGMVPSDGASLEKCLLEGKPVPRASNFGRSISSLSARLTSREGPPPNGSKRGLLSSLFPSRSRAFRS